MFPSPWEADFAAARAGDLAALGRLLDSLGSYLRHIAHDGIPIALHAKADGVDLVQQTFLEATRDFDRFDGASADDLRVWLRGILRHLLGHFRRDFNRLCRLANREVSLESTAPDSGLAIGLVGPESPPDEQLAERETLLALEAAIGRLPGHYRQILRLRTQEDRSYGEIAHLLGITADASQKLWTRAVARLGHEMKAGGYVATNR